MGGDADPLLAIGIVVAVVVTTIAAAPFALMSLINGS
ncbi:hypothetical protein BKA16_001297 [Gordonia humi]|uniref:Uncharacterized protein n=1 Tax=Gordonia humi TaxID=686429 RepID=A0A840EPK4_9ACTN|nr:hypothetical protein [Gordonia humi]